MSLFYLDGAIINNSKKDIRLLFSVKSCVLNMIVPVMTFSIFTSFKDKSSWDCALALEDLKKFIYPFLTRNLRNWTIKFLSVQNQITISILLGPWAGTGLKARAKSILNLDLSSLIYGHMMNIYTSSRSL